MFAVIHFPDKSNPDLNTETLFRLADKFSPLYEMIDTATVAVNINGLNLLYPGGKQEILQAIKNETTGFGQVNIAIGDNLSLTILTALCRPGFNIIESPQVLEEVLLENLDLPPQYAGIFHEWGLKTVKNLTSLPVNDLISRLGSDIEQHLLSLTAGSTRPLKPPAGRRKFRRHIILDEPVETVEACLCLIEDKLKELVNEISRSALAIGEIIITTGGGDDHSIKLKLPIPSNNSRYLIKLLGLEIEKKKTDSLVRNLAIEVIPEPPRRVQLSFWRPPSPDAENLELTLAKLKLLFGPENVGIPVMLDSYDPSAFEIDQNIRPESTEPVLEYQRNTGFVVFRYFLKAIPVKFIKSFKEPYHLQFENRTDRIKRIGGPWLSSGDWWNTGLWKRRETDVQLGGGQILRLIQTENGEFFAEGYYD